MDVVQSQSREEFDAVLNNKTNVPVKIFQGTLLGWLKMDRSVGTRDEKMVRLADNLIDNDLP